MHHSIFHFSWSVRIDVCLPLPQVGDVNATATGQEIRNVLSSSKATRNWSSSGWWVCEELSKNEPTCNYLDKISDNSLRSVKECMLGCGEVKALWQRRVCVWESEHIKFTLRNMWTADFFTSSVAVRLERSNTHCRGSQPLQWLP